MAKKAETKVDGPLEFTIEEQGDQVRLLLVRTRAEGGTEGRSVSIPKEKFNLRVLGLTYDRMLYGFQADYPAYA